MQSLEVGQIVEIDLWLLKALKLDEGVEANAET